MNSPLVYLMLLASSDSSPTGLVRRFTHGFSDSRMPDLSNVWYWVPVIVGPCIITLIAFRWKMRDEMRHGPDYRRLASRLGVSFVDRLLIDRLARRLGKQNGSSLLLSRGMFDYCLTQQSARTGSWALKRLRTVRDQLFT